MDNNLWILTLSNLFPPLLPWQLVSNEGVKYNNFQRREFDDTLSQNILPSSRFSRENVRKERIVGQENR